MIYFAYFLIPINFCPFNTKNGDANKDKDTMLSSATVITQDFDHLNKNIKSMFNVLQHRQF